MEHADSTNSLKVGIPGSYRSLVNAQSENSLPEKKNSSFRTQANLSLLTGILECLVFSGSILGWSSLVYMYKLEGFFNQNCNTTSTSSPDTNFFNGSDTTGNISCEDDDSVLQKCAIQDEIFTSIYLVGASAINFGCLISGFLMDRYGTRIARLITIFQITLGCLLLTIVRKDTAELIYFAIPLMGSGGGGLLVTNIQISHLFPSIRALIITILNGLFGSSTFVFLLFKHLYSYDFAIHKMFLCYTVATSLCYIRTFVLMPKYSIPFNAAEMPNYSFGMAKRADGDKNTKSEGEKFKASFFTWLFALNVLYFGVLVIRWNYFLSSFNAWISNFVVGMFDCHDELKMVSRMTDILGLVQMSEALMLAPLVGGVVDLSRVIMKRRNPSINPHQLQLDSNCVSIVICIVLALLSSWLPTIKVLNVQVATIVCSCLFRSFMVGTTAAFISLCFPNEHFGKLYGITRVVGGLTTFFAVPIFKFVVSHGNQYDMGNYFFVFISSVTFIYPFYIWRTSRQWDTDNVKITENLTPDNRESHLVSNNET